MARTPRKETQLDHIRQDILRAAARAASQVGLGSVTMRDIAREAGYTVGTLYSYFENKAAIETGMIAQLSELILSSLKVPVPTGLNFQQKVELLAHRQLSIADEWRDGLFAIMMVVPGLASTIAQDSTAGVVTAFSEWLDANATPEDVGSRESLEVALFYFGVLEVVLTSAMARKFEGPLCDLLPRIMSLFFHGLSGPAPASAP
ncbi:MAG: helix-turn-helix domain-containing protein [Polyangiaceae bacterium]